MAGGYQNPSSGFNAGAPAAASVRLYADVNTTGSSSSSSVDVSKYAMPGGTLYADGQTVRVVVFFLHAANANNTQENISFGGTITGAISGATSGGLYSIEAIITRLNSTTVVWRSVATAVSAVAVNGGQITGLDFTQPITIKSTLLTSTANGDVAGAGFRVDWFSN